MTVLISAVFYFCKKKKWEIESTSTASIPNKSWNQLLEPLCHGLQSQVHGEIVKTRLMEILLLSSCGDVRAGRGNRETPCGSALAEKQRKTG